MVRGRTPFLTAVALIIMIGLFTRNGDDDVGTEVRVLPVETAVVHYQDRHIVSHEFTGRITSEKRSNLSFDLGGRLQGVLVDHGDVFKKGDALAVLDTTRTEVRQRQAAAQRDEAAAALQLATNTRKRAEETFRENHTSQQRLDEAIAAEGRAKAQLAAAIAAYDMTRVDMGRSTLRAPFDGAVDRRLLDEGVVVLATTPILSVIDAGGMEAQIGMGREHAATLAIGQKFMLDDEDGHSWPAEVIRISSVIRGDTRTMLVAFGFSQPNHGADGELISVVIPSAREARGFWVPISAMTADIRGMWRLYGLQPGENGTFKTVAENVQVLHVEGERAYVTGTINDGLQFVSAGLHRLTQGQLVRPITTSGE